MFKKTATINTYLFSLKEFANKLLGPNTRLHTVEKRCQFTLDGKIFRETSK